MSLLFTLLFGITFAKKPEYQPYDYMRREYPPSNSSDSLGICYGSHTNFNQDPYVVALRYPLNSACCSGSIVSLNPPIILTAAHCVSCNGPVRIGCDDPYICNGDSYAIHQFVQNSDYRDPLLYSNDIAIVRLTNSITTTNAQTVIIPDSEASDGDEVRVVGYGVTQTLSVPRILQGGSTNLLNRETCGGIMSSLLGGTWIDNSMTCFLDESGPPATTACTGDSGGPSGIRPFAGGQMEQYGITSWGLIGSGPGCSGCVCCNGFPSVSVNVPYFASWINGYIQEWTKGNFNYTASGDTHYFYNN